VAQKDPQTYRAATQSSNSHLWQEAIDKELNSIKGTGTWREITVPEGASLVDSIWVFKTKLNERGEVVSTKLGLLPKVSLKNMALTTLTPTALWLTSLRTLLTVVATEDLELYQMDADDAFLNGTSKGDIYMDFPDAYKKQDKRSTGLKLVRSLCGLKQSPRV
jgi:hypothetical protein